VYCGVYCGVYLRLFGPYQKGPRLARSAIQQQGVVGRFSLATNNLDDFVPYHAPQHGTDRSHLRHTRGKQVVEFFVGQGDPLFLQKLRDDLLGTSNLRIRVIGIAVAAAVAVAAAAVVPQPMSGLLLVFHQRAVHDPRRRRTLFVKPVNGSMEWDPHHVRQGNVVLDGHRIQQFLALFRSIPKRVFPAPKIDHGGSPHPEAIDRIKDAAVRH